MYHVGVYFDINPEHHGDFIAAALQDGRDSDANKSDKRRFERIVYEVNHNRCYLNEAYDDAQAFDVHA